MTDLNDLIAASSALRESGAWSALSEHVAEINALHLRDLLDQDDRFEAFSVQVKEQGCQTMRFLGEANRTDCVIPRWFAPGSKRSCVTAAGWTISSQPKVLDASQHRADGVFQA